MSAAEVAENFASRVHTSAVFKSTGKDDSPLERCLKWVLEHTVQGDGTVTPMIVVAVETETRSRYYLAGTVDALWSAARRLTDFDRRWHEVVVTGPCRLYVDIECEFDDAAIAGGSAATTFEQLTAELPLFVATVLHRATELYGAGTILTPLLMQSHKPSKWSAHVVFSGAVFRGALHAGAFAFECARAHPLIEPYLDPGVYSTNHPLRMLRSTKLDEPRRPVVLLDAPTAPLEERSWRRSLITHFEFDGVETTSSFLQLYHADMAADETHQLPPLLEHADAASFSKPKRAAGTGVAYASNLGAQSSGSSRLSSATSEATTILLRCFVDHLATGIQLLDDRPIAFIECRSRACGIRGSDHSTPRSFILLDFVRGTWQQRCHSAKCKGTGIELPWNTGDTELLQACELLRQQDWPAAQAAPCIASWAATVASAQS
jgi:hypothetical protein